MSHGTHGSRVRVLQRWEDQGVSSVAPRQKHYRSPTLGDAKAQSSRVLIQPLMCWRDTQFCFLTGGETPDGPEAAGRLSRLASCSLFSGCWRHPMLNVWKYTCLSKCTLTAWLTLKTLMHLILSINTQAEVRWPKYKKPKWIRTTEMWMIYCFFLFFVC